MHEYSVQDTVAWYSVQGTECMVQCEGYMIQGIVCRAQCAGYSVQCGV